MSEPGEQGSIAFAAGLYSVGLTIFAAGLAVAALGALWRPKKRRLTSPWEIR